MTVMQFWREIGVSAAVSARAEEVLREKKALLSGLPLERWRTAPYEEGLSALKEAPGEDEDGMKLFAAQSMEALLALREYEKRGIGRDIFLATMAFMARFSGETFARKGRAEWTWGWWFPRQLALQEFRLGALEYEMTEGAAFGGKPSGGNKRRIFLHIPADADPLGRRGGRLARYGKGVLFQILPRFCGCGICVRVVDSLPRAL